MTLLELVVLLVVAAIAGALGQALMKRSRGGFAVAMVLGFVGALLGTWLARALGLPPILSITVGNVAFPLVWAILGAMLLVALVGSVPSGRARGRLGGGGRLGAGVSAPSRAILAVSVVLAILAMLAAGGSLAIPFTAFAVMTAAYVVLLLGNLLRGV